MSDSGADVETIDGLLRAVVRRYPKRAAISDSSTRIDYGELSRRVAHVAHQLRLRGVTRGVRVGLYVQRNVSAFVALYGILASGGAAVLLSPEWPPAEVRRRLVGADVKLVVTNASLNVNSDFEVWRIESGEPIELAEANWPESLSVGDDAAYLAFTSGSTGLPKAVVVSHANLVQYAHGIRGRLNLDDATPLCCAHVTTLSADLGHTSWLAALVSGGELHVIADETARDPVGFWDALAQARVNFLKTTPSHMASLLAGRSSNAPRLDTLVLGGEQLSRAFADRCFQNQVTRRLVNHYGPTETTIGAACHILGGIEALGRDETIPIGTAIGDARLLLQDLAGNLVPAEGEGELVIAGSGVAVGYFGEPSEHASRFCTVILQDGELRAYRTGDVCRRGKDGALTFVGRVDRQVKVHGYRVEPEEIERSIERWPGVVRSAVVLRTAGPDRRLAACIVIEPSASKELTLAGLKAHLAANQPEYMRPQPIIVVEKLPLAGTGKVDREKLEQLVASAVATQASGGTDGLTGPAPTDWLVTDLCTSWAEALGVPSVSPQADVFTLGGDSILAMRTVALLYRRGFRVRAEHVYRNPTAIALAGAARSESRASVQPEDSLTSTTTTHVLGPAQRWLISIPPHPPIPWNQAVLLECGKRVDPRALARSVSDVLSRHPLLRQPLGSVGPVGPPVDIDRNATASISDLPNSLATTEAVFVFGAALQRSIDPQSGRNFICHLFSGSGQQHDRLLLLAHHLVIDGVSWRVLLEDLRDAYSAAVRNVEYSRSPAASFWDWTARAANSGQSKGHSAAHFPKLPIDSTEDAEAGPASIMWSLGRRETSHLLTRIGVGAELEAVLLGAFAAAVGLWARQDRVYVEVETHGRDVVTDAERFMETVGWFTAVKRLFVSAAQGRDDAKWSPLAMNLRRSPALPFDAGGSRPEVGFNFLGGFQLPHSADLDWAPGKEIPGPAREGTDPGYRLRLTVRVVAGNLVADLVYDAGNISHRNAEKILDHIRVTLADLVGRNSLPWGRISRPPCTTSGLPLLTDRDYPEAREVPGASVRVQAPTALALVTGATGFVGIHLLRELLARADLRIACLIRAPDDAAARSRLIEVAKAQSLDLPRDGRVVALAGDITLEDMALSWVGRQAMAEAELAFHAAADVRLIAPPQELERTNREGTRRLIACLERSSNRRVSLHLLSTTSVAGTVTQPHTMFSESDFALGQDFLTPYERTKYEAEAIVREWIARGRAASIYRVGHVAAHSRTGAFQQNVSDNRIYQILRSFILTGLIPDKPATNFVFSYVDVLARGICALALDDKRTTFGTWHVESPHEVSAKALATWLVAFGYPVRLGSSQEFERALAVLDQQDSRTAQVATFWTNVAERNIDIDRSRTLETLRARGVEFPKPSLEWFHAALTWAVGIAFLPPPQRANF